MQAILTSFQHNEADFSEKLSNIGLGLLRLSMGQCFEVTDQTFTEQPQLHLITRLFLGAVALTIALPLTLLGAVFLLFSTSHSDMLQRYVASLQTPPPPSRPASPITQELLHSESAIETFVADPRCQEALNVRGTLNFRTTQEDRLLSQWLTLHLAEIPDDLFPKAVYALYFLAPNTIFSSASNRQIEILATAPFPVQIAGMPDDIRLADFALPLVESLISSEDPEIQQKMNLFLTSADPAWVVRNFSAKQWSLIIESRRENGTAIAALRPMILAIQTKFPYNEQDPMFTACHRQMIEFFQCLNDDEWTAALSLRNTEGQPLLMDAEYGAAPYFVPVLIVCQQLHKYPLMANAHKDLPNPVDFFRTIRNTLPARQYNMITPIILVLGGSDILQKRPPLSTSEWQARRQKALEDVGFHKRRKKAEKPQEEQQDKTPPRSPVQEPASLLPQENEQEVPESWEELTE